MPYVIKASYYQSRKWFFSETVPINVFFQIVSPETYVKCKHGKYSKLIDRFLVTWPSLMVHADSKYHIDQFIFSHIEHCQGHTATNGRSAHSTRPLADIQWCHNMIYEPRARQMYCDVSKMSCIVCRMTSCGSMVMVLLLWCHILLLIERNVTLVLPWYLTSQ